MSPRSIRPPICAVQRGDVSEQRAEVRGSVVADVDPAEVGAGGLDGVAQAVRLLGVTGERRTVHTGAGQGAEVVGVSGLAAGDQRDPVTLLAETVGDGHAEAGACAENKDHRNGS